MVAEDETESINLESASGLGGIVVLMQEQVKEKCELLAATNDHNEKQVMHGTPKSRSFRKTSLKKYHL